MYSYSQHQSRKKKRGFFFWLLCGSAILLLLGTCYVVTAPGVLGYRQTGMADAPDELPPFLRRWSPFVVRWPAHFTVSYHPHQSATFLMCGYSSGNQIESTCRQFNLELLRPGDDEEIHRGNNEVQDTLRFLDKGEKHFFENETFRHGDWTFLELSRSRSIRGLFRPRDGYFVIMGQEDGVTVTGQKTGQKNRTTKPLPAEGR